MAQDRRSALLPREWQQREVRQNPYLDLRMKHDLRSLDSIVVENAPIIFVNESVDAESLESITWQHHFIPRTPCLWLFLGIEIGLLVLLLVAVLTWD